MRYFAVIDTNVLVSALLRFDSIPGQTVQEALGGAIVPLLSKEILAEYGEVLRRAKFPFAEQDILDVLSGIRACGLNVELDQIPLETPDPDDAVFYAVVMEKRKDADAYLERLQGKMLRDVPEHLRPASIRPVSALPSTPSGKIDYRALEALAGE